MIIIIIIIKKESTLYDYHYSDNYNTFDQKISFDFWLPVIIMGSMYDNYDNNYKDILSTQGKTNDGTS